MRAYFGRRYMLSASHRLHSESLSDEENRAAYGKCNNPHGHGHNYVIEVLAAGAVDPETGMVVNLAVLDEVVQTRILNRFDHTNLNHDPLFTRVVPTTENLCKAVYQLLEGSLDPATRIQVRVEETENNFFEYSGADSGKCRDKTCARRTRNVAQIQLVMNKSKSSAVHRCQSLKDFSTQDMYREILRRIGEDPDRDGLMATPARVEKSMAFLTKGYHEDPNEIAAGRAL